MESWKIGFLTMLFIIREGNHDKGPNGNGPKHDIPNQRHVETTAKGSIKARVNLADLLYRQGKYLDYSREEIAAWCGGPFACSLRVK